MYVGRVEKLLAHYSQIPLCFVNLNGKITRASSKIAEVFKYDGIIGRDIFELTRIKPAELIEAAQNETNLYLDSNDKSFKILSEFIGEGETASIMKIDKKKIEMKTPIKQAGETEVTLKLFTEISAQLKVSVTIA